MFLTCLVVLVVLAGPYNVHATYDTIIVGMGVAGSTAAAELAKAGKNVLALEAQDMIGGRVRTVPFGDGVVELGAEWAYGTDNSFVYDLVQRHNITLLPDESRKLVFSSDGAAVDQQLVLELVDYLTMAAWEPPKMPEPIGEFLNRKTKEYLKEKHPSVASDTGLVDTLLYFLDNQESTQRWHNISTASKPQGLKGYRKLSWSRKGYKTFFDLVWNSYMNSTNHSTLQVLLNKEVTNISWPQEPASPVMVSCKDGSSYSATNVIVTVSLGVLKDRYKTLFTPPLPEEKVKSIEALSMRDLCKIHLAFNEIWWPKNTSIGFLWREEDRESIPAEDKWTTRINGLSFPKGSSNVATIWVNAQDVKMVETMDEDILKSKIMKIIRKFLGATMNVTEPYALVRSNWSTNPYTLGSYTYNLTPQYTEVREKLSAPLKDSKGAMRVLFSGEATHPSHYATVHGAADTGIREARRLLNKKDSSKLLDLLGRNYSSVLVAVLG